MSDMPDNALEASTQPIIQPPIQPSTQPIIQPPIQPSTQPYVRSSLHNMMENWTEIRSDAKLTVKGLAKETHQSLGTITDAIQSLTASVKRLEKLSEENGIELRNLFDSLKDDLLYGFNKLAKESLASKSTASSSTSAKDVPTTKPASSSTSAKDVPTTKPVTSSTSAENVPTTKLATSSTLVKDVPTTKPTTSSTPATNVSTNNPTVPLTAPTNNVPGTTAVTSDIYKPESSPSSLYRSSPAIPPPKLPGMRKADGLLDIGWFINHPGEEYDETMTLVAHIQELWSPAISSYQLSGATRSARNASRPFMTSERIEHIHDPSIKQKLFKWQMQLKQELTPYETWPDRVMTYLDGDFRSLQSLITSNNLTWIQLLDAIFTILIESHAFDLPVSEFAEIRKENGESVHTFCNRLRTAFYGMSAPERRTTMSLSLLKQKLRIHAPAVYSRLVDTTTFSDSFTIVETACSYAAVNYSVKEQPPTQAEEMAKLLSAPDAASFLVKHNDCFKCGKFGHWAKDCTSSVQPRDSQYKRTDGNYPKTSDRLTSHRSNSTQHRPAFNSRRAKYTPRQTNKRRVYLVESDHSSEDDDDVNGGDGQEYMDHRHNQESEDEKHDRNLGRASTDVKIEQTMLATEHVYTTDTIHAVTIDRCRDGQFDKHNIFSAVMGNINTTVFLDYGSTSCWVEDTLPITAFESSSPVNLKGVGRDLGPRVTKNAIVTLKFRDKNGALSPVVIVCCGVVPARTFPAPITLGKSLFHALHCRFMDDDRVEMGLWPSKFIIEALRYDSTFVSTPSTPDPTTDFVNTLIAAYPYVFKPRKNQHTGRTSKVRHTIDVGNAKPVKHAPSRLSPRAKTAVDEFIASGVRQNLIRPSMSEWASRLTCPPKKDGTLRICVDYRDVNASTKKHAFPLPNTNDELNRAAGHAWYIHLDLKAGFWQIPMEASSIDKTAFCSDKGLFEYLVMPFGLTNAPATCQALLNECLHHFKDWCSGYIDDILLWAGTVTTLLERAHLVLHRLSQFGLMLNVSKCRWFVQSTTYLGFIVSRNGIAADPEKISALLNRPMPSTTTEVRSFLSAASYFRQLIKGFADIASSLYDATKGEKNQKLQLDHRQRVAWKALQDALTKAPVCKAYDWTKPAVIDTDSSQLHVGGVLLQPWLCKYSERSILHPVAYYSHKLTETQQRYSSQERELLAVLLSLTHWKYWVEGQDITVRTDHDSLKGVRTKKELPTRLLRFLDTIEHYNPTIVYRSGKTNVVADWLSRPKAAEPIFPIEAEADDDSTPAEESASDEEKTLENLSQADLAAIAASFTSDSEDLPLPLKNLRSQFTTIESTLHLLQRTKSKLESLEVTTLLKILDYSELCEEASKIHTRLGHVTIGITLQELKMTYWHPDLVLAATEATRTCAICQLMKPPPSTAGSMTPIEPSAPLTRWGTDFIGPFSTGTPPTPIYILTAIEYTTSYGVAFMSLNTTGGAVGYLLAVLLDNFPFISELITDQGAGFIDKGVQDMLKHRNVKCHKASPAHPQSNGKVERFNGQLKGIIGHLLGQEGEFVFQNSDQLMRILRKAVLQYNTTPCVFGYSPLYLMFGTQNLSTGANPGYTRELSQQEEEDAVQTHITMNVDLVQQKRAHFTSQRYTRDVVRSKLQQEKALLKVYEKGDWVLRVRQRHHKLEPFYDGPYQIVKVLPKNVYRLRTPGGILLPNDYNSDRLFPAYVSDHHPIRSLWYASKKLLEADRQRQLRDVA